MSIRIITDSTCDLPKEVIGLHGISVVPLYINFGAEGYLDGIELTRQAFYERLPDSNPLPTTSTPGIDAFKQIYNQLITEGATEIISIHISESLSATVNVARAAANDNSKIPITVYDSGQLSLGTGFLVLRAAQAAREGLTKNEILRILEEQAPRTYVFAALDTLDYLRRSGRMNSIIAGIGGLLRIKPILTMHNGNPGAERVRTREGAIRRLIQMVEELGPLQKLALVHTNAPKEAQDLRKKALHLFPNKHEEPLSVDVTPVLGTHIGPGVVGFACVKA